MPLPDQESAGRLVIVKRFMAQVCVRVKTPVTIAVLLIQSVKV